MLDLFKVSNQTLIQRLDDLKQLKEASENDRRGFFDIKYTPTGATVRVPTEELEPIIREQLILVQDELRRRFG